VNNKDKMLFAVLAVNNGTQPLETVMATEPDARNLKIKILWKWF